MNRLNELVRNRRFASHVIDARVGNSEKVRRDHYPLVTDAVYKAAVSGVARNPGTLTAHQEPSTLHDSRENRLHSLEDAES